MAEKEKVSIVYNLHCIIMIYTFSRLWAKQIKTLRNLSFNFSHCNGRLVDSVE